VIALAAAPVRTRGWILAGVTPDELSGDDILATIQLPWPAPLANQAGLNTAQSFRFAHCGKRKSSYINHIDRKTRACLAGRARRWRRRARRRILIWNRGKSQFGRIKPSKSKQFYLDLLGRQGLEITRYFL
jgi:hypothetical protein